MLYGLNVGGNRSTRGKPKHTAKVDNTQTQKGSGSITEPSPSSCELTLLTTEVALVRARVLPLIQVASCSTGLCAF